MNPRISALLLLLSAGCLSVRAQTAQQTNPQAGVSPRNSGPLQWTVSDVNPKTVFWIQGRFVPVDDSADQNEAEVATILCSARESECVEFDGTTPLAHGEQVWIDDFKAVSWDKAGILATGRSLDGCTDETLKIRFSPPSVTLINSPVLPMSDHCKQINKSWDKLLAKKGSGIAAQTEEDQLVPTRGLFPWTDVDLPNGPTPVGHEKP